MRSASTSPSLRHPRATRWTRQALWIVPLFAAACDSCGGCSGALATLEKANGDITRDYSEARRQWVTAPVGATFDVGDAVRTTSDATAQLRLRGGGGLKLVENTVIRFLSEQPTAKDGQLSLEVGEAAVTAGEDGMAILGGFGLARIAPGSEMRITAEEGQVAFQVLIGSARIEGEGMEAVTMEAGDPELVLDLELGTVVIEENAEADADAEADAGADADAEADADAGVDEATFPVTIRGVVQREDEDGRWQTLPRGTETLAAGTTLRLRGRARIVISRGEDRATIFGPGQVTLVGSNERFADLASGRANLSASEENLAMAVPGGGVVTRASGDGSTAEVALRRGNAEVYATQGSSELQGNAGERYLVRSGQRATITEAGGIEAENRAPARAHLALNAGTSAFIHDPNTPVAVKLTFAGKCPGEGVVEVGRGARGIRSFGQASANVALHRGRHRYTVRCAENGTPKGSAVAEGTLTILRDSGRARIPIRPPRNVVDTDGRRYTLLYQNLLPIVVVRWRQAPEASQYTLVVERQGGATKRVVGSNPQVTLDSGDVPEGTHRMHFEAGGQRSATTTVTVGYDNAASAVFLREPGTGPVTGTSVPVSGVVMEGWSVSVGGNSLPLDNQFRFSGTAPVPSEVDAVAVRLNHPRHGVHYYLRRIAR